MRRATVDLPILAAAWRLAAEIAGRYAEGEVVPVRGSADLLVRDAVGEVATFVFGEEPELHGVGQPPMPVAQWSWPMPHRELRRLAGQATRGARRGGWPSEHPVGRVTAQVVARVLGELVMRGEEAVLMDPRDASHLDFDWLPAEADVSDATPSWLLRVRADVIGVFRGGWFYTRRGESIHLYARYLAGASIGNLAETVLWPERPGSRPRPGWFPPELVADIARHGEDLSGISLDALKHTLFGLRLRRTLASGEDLDDAQVIERLEAEIDRRAGGTDAV